MTIPDRPGRSIANKAPIRMNAIRVLLVEDESRLRDMLLRAVSDMGFEAHGVASAEAALRVISERPPEIVVLDLNLPGMSGMDLFAAIRKSHPQTQVIVLTGFGALDAAQRAIHYDAVDFLTKPCALGDLEVSLDRARGRVIQMTVAAHAAEPIEEPAAPPAPTAPPEDNSLETMERRHILSVLEKNNGNRTQTAAELGISLRKLYYRLGQYQREGSMSQQ
jgi:DNA-binding NtrC family response regulator